jgi:hypothetical protein
MKYLLYSVVSGILLFPQAFASAQGGGRISTQTVALENPLNGINSIDALLVAILNILIVIMIPIIVFFIIMAGFKYVTARGNASQIQEATRALTYAIIGAVLILGAVALSDVIKNTVNQF